MKALNVTRHVLVTCSPLIAQLRWILQRGCKSAVISAFGRYSIRDHTVGPHDFQGRGEQEYLLI